jgi:hypothetical protein
MTNFAIRLKTKNLRFRHFLLFARFGERGVSQKPHPVVIARAQPEARSNPVIISLF